MFFPRGKLVEWMLLIPGVVPYSDSFWWYSRLSPWIILKWTKLSPWVVSFEISTDSKTPKFETPVQNSVYDEWAVIGQITLPRYVFDFFHNSSPSVLLWFYQDQKSLSDVTVYHFHPKFSYYVIYASPSMKLPDLPNNNLTLLWPKLSVTPL